MKKDSQWMGSFYSTKFGKHLISGKITVHHSKLEKDTSDILLQLLLDIQSVLSSTKVIETTMLASITLKEGKRNISGKTFLPGNKKLCILLEESTDQKQWTGTYEIHQPFLPSDHGVMTIS